MCDYHSNIKKLLSKTSILLKDAQLCLVDIKHTKGILEAYDN